MRVEITDLAETDLEQGYLFYEQQQLSKHFPFAVYYSIAEDIVLVTAVLDCRRNPSWIRRKLKEL